MSKKIKEFIGKLRYNKKMLIIGNIFAIIFLISDINSLFDWQSHNSMKKEIKKIKSDINNVEFVKDDKKQDLENQEKKLKEEQFNLYNNAVIEFNGGNYFKSMELCENINHKELLKDKKVLIEKITIKHKEKVLKEAEKLITEDKFDLAKEKLQEYKKNFNDKEVENLISKINSLDKINKEKVEKNKKPNRTVTQQEALELVGENLQRIKESNDIFISKEGIKKIYEEEYYAFKVYIEGREETGFHVVNLNTMIHYKYYENGELVVVL